MTALLLLALLQDGGPKNHEVRSASSPDGLDWTHDDVVLLRSASVPTVAVTDDGKVRLYFVDASRMPETVNAVESTDGGKTFEKTDFKIEGLSKFKALDPSIVKLDDGRWRLYYFGCAKNPDESGAHSMFAAISDDGIRFKEEGAVFSREGLVDPDVFWSGTEWIMHVFSLTDGGTVVARSKDGLEFEYHGILEPRRWGVTAPVKLDDGTLRMYGFDQGKQRTIRSFTSADGLKWEQEEGVRLEAPEGKEITDPFVVRLDDGSWKMFYKVSAPPKRRP